MEPSPAIGLGPAATSDLGVRKQQDQIPGVDSHGHSDEPLRQGVLANKRHAEDDGAEEAEEDHEPPNEELEENGEPAAPLSKNQQRKLKRRKLWEEKKAERTLKRKDKRQEKKERKRLEYEELCRQAAIEGRPIPERPRPERERNPERQTRVPISIVIDCQYESYMLEKELISLSSQVTRCYSDNRTARYPVHLYVSSFGGVLLQRYDGALGGQYKKWKGMRFVQDDFVATSALATEAMAAERGGTLAGALCDAVTETDRAEKQSATVPDSEPEDANPSIVYLTADSPHILERLSPNTTYVVGGIIDRNREKGLCYKIARQRNVRTAKLPIGEYMVLRDRHVLATNHVVEIMLRWLEEGDWGAAFMKVIPQRKGGQLKTADDGDGDDDASDNEDHGARETLTNEADQHLGDLVTGQAVNEQTIHVADRDEAQNGADEQSAEKQTVISPA